MIWGGGGGNQFSKVLCLVTFFSQLNYTIRIYRALSFENLCAQMSTCAAVCVCVYVCVCVFLLLY
jgi:hypothetical protein